jgi:hypothetical protein
MPILDLPAVLQDRAKGFDCADAAAPCVLQFHRVVGRRPRIGTPPDGADPRHLEGVLRHAHLRVISGEMDVADLDHFCRTGRPPICLVHWPGDPDSHYVVLRGVSKTGRHVFYHDVWDGRGRCSTPEFEAAWLARGRLNEAFRSWAIVAFPPRPKN